LWGFRDLRVARDQEIEAILSTLFPDLNGQSLCHSLAIGVFKEQDFRPFVPSWAKERDLREWHMNGQFLIPNLNVLPSWETVPELGLDILMATCTLKKN
jgi:hypothetical protein